MTITVPDNKDLKQMTMALMNWFESQDISTTTAGIVMANLIAMDLVVSAKSKKDLEEGYTIFGEMLGAQISMNWQRIHDKQRPKT
jgi:hypothetical protein